MPSGSSPVGNGAPVTVPAPHGGVASTAASRAADRVERLSYLLDESIRVPGTGMRIGLDGLIGLIPGVGDAASALVSLYLVAEAHRAGATSGLIVRMLGNVAVDGIVGSIPLLGDLFDFGFKANRRNMKLLRQHLDRQR